MHRSHYIRRTVVLESTVDVVPGSWECVLTSTALWMADGIKSFGSKGAGVLGRDRCTGNQPTVPLCSEEDLLHPGWHGLVHSQQVQGWGLVPDVTPMMSILDPASYLGFPGEGRHPQTGKIGGGVHT